MSREVHVRICEGVGVRFPHATRLSYLTEFLIKYIFGENFAIIPSMIDFGFKNRTLGDFSRAGGPKNLF
jgi:hypothetical protein